MRRRVTTATGRRSGATDAGARSIALRSLFADLSGMDAASLDSGAAFLELGLDSLFLTQAALQLQKTFGVKVVVPRAAGGALDDRRARRPPRRHRSPPMRRPRRHSASRRDCGHRRPRTPPTGGSVERLIAEQLEVMRQQLEMLRGGGARAPRGCHRRLLADGEPRCPPSRAATSPTCAGRRRSARTGRRRKAPSRRAHDRSRSRRSTAFVERYTRRTAGSKAVDGREPPAPRRSALRRRLPPPLEGDRLPDRHRRARPARGSGTSTATSTSISRTASARSCSATTPTSSARRSQGQLEQGIEIGPQTPLAGEVAELRRRDGRHGARRRSATPAPRR